MSDVGARRLTKVIGVSEVFGDVCLDERFRGRPEGATTLPHVLRLATLSRPPVKSPLDECWGRPRGATTLL